MASPDRDRDRTTVRRALTAGVGLWVGISAVVLPMVIRAGGEGSAGVVVVAIAMVAGSLLASAWLLLAACLDLVAGEPPGRRRTIWTVVLILFTFASPLLVVGAQAAR